jgi:hypothetical protein
LVFGGAWPHHADDEDLKAHGFRACHAAEREAVEAAIGAEPEPE